MPIPMTGRELRVLSIFQTFESVAPFLVVFRIQILDGLSLQCLLEDDL